MKNFIFGLTLIASFSAYAAGVCTITENPDLDTTPWAGWLRVTCTEQKAFDLLRTYAIMDSFGGNMPRQSRAHLVGALYDLGYRLNSCSLGDTLIK